MSKLLRNTFSPNFQLSDRIYSQYSDKPKFRKWMNITRRIGSEIADGAQQVRKSLDIDTATGESLQIISRIVVIDRILEEIKMNPGIFDKTLGTNFANKKNGFAPWSTMKNAKVQDELLRLVIRAKIIKNASFVTQDELLDAFQFIFPEGKIFRILNHHDMSFSVEYVGILSPLEQTLIDKFDFIPTPQGVRLRGFIKSFGIIEFLKEDDFCFGNEELEFIE